MDGEKNEKQVFVRNLAYETTENDLTELFQTFGPLKNATIAKGPDGVSKGFGFVKFALEEDAAAALAKLDGSSLHGRKMKLELGVKKERTTKKEREAAAAAKANEEVEKKVPTKKEPKVKSEKPVKVEVKEEAGEEEADDSTGHIKRSRQILVFGVPVDISKKAFKMAMSKISKKSEVELMKEENELSSSLHIISPPGKIMLITAISRQEAAKIMTTLNKPTTTVHNLEIRKYMDHAKNGDEGAAAAAPSGNKPERLVARTLADMTELEYRKRKCRLILRNLSFQAVEQNVIDKMSKFGPLVSVEMPRTIIEKTNTNRKSANKKRARNEDGTNDEEETDAASPDQIADNQVLRPKGFAFVTFLCEKDAKQAVESSAGLKVCNREVALDFCMNKESYTKYGMTNAEGEEEAAEAPADETKVIEEKKDEVSNEDNDSAEKSDAEDDSASGEDVDDDDADSGSEGADDKEEVEEEEAEDEEEKKPSDDVQEGCTVFIRGLPFDAEANDIRSEMKQFGRVTMSIVVKDKATGISKGSAFVKFSKPEEAQKCLEAGSSVNIKDRMCKVNLAVDRESAQKLKTEDRHGKDKRNLYLANEGLLTPKEGGKDAKNDMSEADKEKRQRAQNEKRKKLQNPLFFVSGNRLSIRNLGKNVTDHELKVACLKAVNSALSRKLVTVKDLEQHIAAQGSATTVTNVIPPVNNKNCVKSAKVMLDLTRVKEGVPQSRGYGFVEFTHHAHALACLRELNNNSRYNDISTTGGGSSAEGGAKGRLIVEFSLENIQKVKVLQEREARQKKHRAEKASDNSNSSNNSKKETSTKSGDAESDAEEEDEPKKKKTKSDHKTVSSPAAPVESKKEKPAKSAAPPSEAVAETAVPAAANKKADKKRKLETEETSKPVKETKESDDSKKQAKKAKHQKSPAAATPAPSSKDSVAVSDAPVKKVLSPEEEAKLAEKRARQKKRKEEFKAVRAAARKADRVAKHAAQKADKKAKREAEGVVEGENSSAGNSNSNNKSGGKGKQPQQHQDKNKSEEPSKKAWGGHKRLREQKKNKSGGGSTSKK